MVHVGIAAEEHHIHFVPAAQFHLFLRGGQPVGRLVVGGMVHGGMWVDGFNGPNWSNKTNGPNETNRPNWSNKTNRSNETDWANKTDWLDWLSGQLLFWGILLLHPLEVEDDELMEAEGLHVAVVDDVDAEVQQVFAIGLLRGDERADVQAELLQYALVHYAVAVDKVLEQGILLYGLQVGLGHLYGAGTCGVCLNGVHVLSFIG